MGKKQNFDNVYRKEVLYMDDKNMYNAPVYTNTPIGSEDIDYVGLKSYANHIDVALSKSNVIGIIGDFGTGKSSLIEYLKNNKVQFTRDYTG